MWLRKHATPGSASGGFTWDSPEHVVEVPDHIGEELLRIGGFEVSEAPVAGPQDDRTWEGDSPSEGDNAGAGAEQTSLDPEVTEAPVAPKRRGGRKPASPTVSE